MHEGGFTVRRVLALVCLFAVLGTGCTGSTSTEISTIPRVSGSPTPVTLKVWSAFTGRQLTQFDHALAMFHDAYPWITVESSGAIEDQKIIAAINSGTPPDAVLSFVPDNVGKFCTSGAFISLNSIIEQDGLDMDQFVPATRSYTQYEGNQCTLPLMADARGLYYNEDMFRAAGITQPPQTFSELTADAKKLTQFNPDGSIKVAGFVPWWSYYEGNLAEFAHQWNAQWFDANGKAAAATDPQWAAMFTWQKELVDFYGEQNLAEFVAAGQAHEWASSNDFEIGRTAMQYDGEWRVAFLESEHPELNYGTAPAPVGEGASDMFGSSLIGGNVVGIPRGSAHPGEAWLLIKYLSTNTDVLVYLTNALKNLPTTTAALDSPDLQLEPQFKMFFEIFSHPKSAFSPILASGSGYQDPMTNFGVVWQAGKVPDLQQGLQQVAQQTDDMLSLG